MDPRTGCHILLIDDDHESRDAVAALLTEIGISVTEVSSAPEALRRLRGGERPDVIVLDLMLPGMDGWDFRAVQKSDPALASIPAVAMSGSGKLLDAARSLRKPIDPQELLSALAELC
mgnify:CR=1 FL=1